MSAFDIHQHLWPEAFIAALAGRRKPPRLRGRTLELSDEAAAEVDLGAHDLDERIRLLDTHGVDTAVVSLPPTLETDHHDELRAVYDEAILELVRAANGRLAAFSAGSCRTGFAGVCVSAGALVRGVDSLLSDVEAAGQIVFVHPGPAHQVPDAAPRWWPGVIDYTAQMQAAYAMWLARDADRYPNMPIVFAILAGGAPFQLERFRSHGVDVRTALRPNVYLDTASYGRRALELAFSAYGITQVVYGSDTPVLRAELGLRDLRSFGDAVFSTVVDENASRLLA